MQRYAPKAMELAPRDIVSRSIQTEINEGRGFNNSYVHLDIRHIGEKKILENLPGICDIAIQFAGIDPIKQPIPIQPAQHYTMGGIDCNVKCETILKGLYAAGECACVSVHGANRLGGNSLLETAVFGKIAGEQAGRFAKSADNKTTKHSVLRENLAAQRERLQHFLDARGDEDPSLIRDGMRDLMVDKAFLFRDGKGLEDAKVQLKQMNARIEQLRPIAPHKIYNLDLVRCIELKDMLTLCEVIVGSALSREESRGSHVRLDFPKRDDARFLKHTLAFSTDDGPRIAFSDVKITTYQPEERKY